MSPAKAGDAQCVTREGGQTFARGGWGGGVQPPADPSASPRVCCCGSRQTKVQSDPTQSRGKVKGVLGDRVGGRREGSPTPEGGGGLVQSFGMQRHPESIVGCCRGGTSRPRATGSRQTGGCEGQECRGAQPMGQPSPVHQSITPLGGNRGCRARFLVRPGSHSWKPELANSDQDKASVCRWCRPPGGRQQGQGELPGIGEVHPTPCSTHPGWDEGCGCHRESGACPG